MEYRALTITKRLAALETVQRPLPRLLVSYVEAGQTDDNITGATIGGTTYQRHHDEAVTDFMQRLESCPDLPAIAFAMLNYKDN
jgi:hypothetical protein